MDKMANAIALDVLREIGNIGAGNAATALAKMINQKVDMSVPKVNILGFSEVPTILGGEENLVAGIFFRIFGEMNGTIMFVLPTDSANLLVDFIMPGFPFELGDELSASALSEMGNILSGSYIASLAGLTGLDIQISTPSLCIDMAGAILSVPAIEFGLMGDTVLIIENDFFDHESEKTVEGYFFLIPDQESMEVLLKRLGVEV